MKRRSFLAGATALPLAHAAAAQPVAGSVLRFVPEADLVSTDPTGSATPETRDHALLVYDTLFGIDAAGVPQGQMLDSWEIADSGLEWRLRLRPGVTFHDRQSVMPADCVASIRRWAARDYWGQALMAATADLSGFGDLTIIFRLNSLFPMLPMVLGKTTPRLCAIMPARIAATDPFQPLGEITGCGPYTYDATGREAGKRVVYQRYEPYIPSRVPVSGGAGAKEATIERIEWAVMSDAAEVQAALLGGTIDWWQAPPARSLGPLLADKGVRLRRPLSRGSIAALRFNHLHKPFDRPEVRRAIFAAVSQSAYMTALGGGYGPDWRDRVGFFCPDSPSASDAGMEDLAAAADPTRARRELAVAGGIDTPLVLLVNADRDVDKRLAGVTEAMLKGLGLTVQVQALAAAAYETRLADTRPPADGGWHLSHACVAGDEQADPVGHTLLRAGGRSAAAGWPTIPRIETLVAAWLSAPDASWQKRFVDQMQRIAFAELPYVPLGQFFPPSAIRSNLKGVLDGPPMFWNLERV